MHNGSVAGCLRRLGWRWRRLIEFIGLFVGQQFFEFQQFLIVKQQLIIQQLVQLQQFIRRDRQYATGCRDLLSFSAIVDRRRQRNRPRHGDRR
jgi:hypothetical protein